MDKDWLHPGLSCNHQVCSLIFCINMSVEFIDTSDGANMSSSQILCLWSSIQDFALVTSEENAINKQKLHCNSQQKASCAQYIFFNIIFMITKFIFHNKESLLNLWQINLSELTIGWYNHTGQRPTPLNVILKCFSFVILLKMNHQKATLAFCGFWWKKCLMKILKFLMPLSLI